jgi:hypothetical protein
MFWDSSALVPVFIAEPWSEEISLLYKTDEREISVWWGTILECRSAIFRKRRSNQLKEYETREALDYLVEVSVSWDEVVPEESIRLEASRLLSIYPLRTADALQLAAALLWANHQPAGKSFVCLDEKLREVAQTEGFSLVPKEL